MHNNAVKPINFLNILCIINKFYCTIRKKFLRYSEIM